jgi:hypothetical protein
MTKLLDADWLRGVQLFHSQNKQNGGKVFWTQMWTEISQEELDENTNKSTTFLLKIWQDWALAREYDVDIEKYPILSR